MSYSARDRSSVRAVVSDLQDAGFESWHDERTPGGAAWWDTILEKIEGCDLVVMLLSETSNRSRWCAAEIDYAQACGKPLLPLMIDEIEPDELYGVLRATEYIDYTTDSRQAGIRLATAARELIANPPPVPPQRPERPDDPVPNLDPVRAALAAPELSLAAQQEVLVQLERFASDVDLAELVHAMLVELRNRNDITRRVSEEIDGLLAKHLASTVHRKKDPGSADLLRSLITQIRRRRCTPVVGFGISDGLAGTREELADHLAKLHSFPLAEHLRHDLPQVAQFTSVMMDPETLREEVAGFLNSKLTEAVPDLVPSSTDADLWADLGNRLCTAWSIRRTPAEPLEVIAGLNCPIFVNAHPTSLLAHAASELGKKPEIVVCDWRDDLDDLLDSYTWQALLDREPDYVPSVDRPLIFQVFGLAEVPDSVVFTDDEYLDFLTQVHRQDLVPPPVQAAFANNAMLFLGMGLEERDMKVLLRLLASNHQGRRRQRPVNVAAQVDPGRTALSRERAKEYMIRYFREYREPSVGVFWGTPQQLTTELTKMMDAGDG